MVVLTHLHGYLERIGGPSLTWGQAGMYGVDLFFVISGFIIWTTSRELSVTPQRFLVRRVSRIVPLYWAMTTFIVAVSLLAPRLLASTEFDLWHVIASYLFIPTTHPLFPASWPILIPGWTLNYEMFFYALFAAGLCLRNRTATFIFVVGALLIAVLLGHALRPQQPAVAFFTDPIVLEFALGMAAGAAYTDARRLPVSLAIAALLAAVAVVAGSAFVDWIPRVIFAGVPAAALVLAVAILKRNDIDLENGPIVLLGDASYSIYLSHVIILPVVTKVWLLAAPDFNLATGLLFVTLQLSIALVSGIAIYKCFELPALHWLRSRLDGPRKPAAAAPIG